MKEEDVCYKSIVETETTADFWHGHPFKGSFQREHGIRAVDRQKNNSNL